MQTLEYLDYRPTFGIKMRIFKSDVTHRKDLGIEYTIAAGVTGPLEHYHPTLTETFEVLSGQLEIKVDGKWQGLVPGKQLAVHPYQKHTFRNSSSADVVIMTWIEPHGGFAEFFTDLWYLVKTGQYRSQWNLKFVAQYALLEKKHRKDFLSVQPYRFALRMYAAMVSLFGFRLPKFPTPEEVAREQKSV
ncbi:MAG: cupin domain-containing protein [Bacteroidia bacterium]|nr:cupin domain-containing protein [Bacteroidia bacterium]